MNEELSKALESLFNQYGRKQVKDAVDRVEAALYSNEITLEWLKVFVEREDTGRPFEVIVPIPAIVQQMAERGWISVFSPDTGRSVVHVTNAGRLELKKD